LPQVDSIACVTDEANSEEPVLVEQRDRILIITINRPKARNAVNAEVSRGLADAMDRLDGEDGRHLIDEGGYGWQWDFAENLIPSAFAATLKPEFIFYPPIITFFVDMMHTVASQLERSPIDLDKRGFRY